VLIVLFSFVLFAHGRQAVDTKKVSNAMSSWKSSNIDRQNSQSSHNNRSQSHNSDSESKVISLEKTHRYLSVTPGQQEFTIARPEGTRTFYVWVPKSYTGTTAYPLIIAFHGLGDDCTNFGPETGLQELSETSNFLYAYPCGWPGLLGNAWNSGTCCNLIGPDDVTFAKLIVSTVQQNYNLNVNKVYAAGFSNGAMMAEILGCVAPDVFHATVSVSGIVELEPGNAGGLAACSTAYSKFTQRVSTANVHGDLDFVVPWTGDALLGFPDVPTNFADWATRNQCQGDPVQTFSKGAYTESTYQNCTDGTTVRVVHHYGGGHEWPSDGDFDTATYVVDFFYQS